MKNQNQFLAFVPQDQLEAIQSDLNEIKALLHEKESSRQSTSERFLCSREAAELLGIDLRTLMVWRKKGCIRCSKVGKKLFFKYSELTAIIDRNQLN